MKCVCGHQAGTHNPSGRCQGLSLERAQCDCEGFITADDLASGIDSLVAERDQLVARVKALESQLTIHEEGCRIDHRAHEVYRRAAMYLATYVAGARSGVELSDDPSCRNTVKMWGELADEVEECLKREQVH